MLIFPVRGAQPNHRFCIGALVGERRPAIMNQCSASGYKLNKAKAGKHGFEFTPTRSK
jgi:hypothetical protein